MLGHNGLFGDFLKELRSLGGMQSPLMDQTGLPVSLQAFDGSPVYEDLAVLNRWLKTEEASSNPRNATFYNTLPLHDGNHFPGQSKTADYKVRAQKLFDDLDNFFTELEKSGRKVMVVVVPEHGGALKGDKMQVSGLRDIPSPSITNVPTAVKFFGLKAPHEGGADYHRSAQQLSGGVGAGGARPRRQNVQRGQRQLAAVCRLTCRRARRCPRTPTPSSSSIRASLMSS